MGREMVVLWDMDGSRDKFHSCIVHRDHGWFYYFFADAVVDHS